MELVYNGGATPDIWQETALGDQTTVWQTNTDDGFCTDTTFCTFLEFKEEYATARFFGVQVGIGTGVPPVTSYADGVSMTIVEDGTEVTDTWDFDVAAAPTPTAVPPDPAPATPVASGGGVPDTSTGTSDQPNPGVGIVLGSLAILSAVAVTVAIVRRRRLSR